VDNLNRRKLVDALTALAEVFDKKASELMINAYLAALADVPADQVIMACSRAVKECRWLPKPVELRELSGELAPQNRATIAWEAFARAARDPYHSVDFDDPIVNATVRNLGGWIHLTSIDGMTEFEVFLRKRFETTYVSLYRSGVSPEQAAPLVGIFDQENQLAGYGVRTPLRIATGLPPAAVRITAAAKREPLGIGVALQRVS
jgi:hypothetical protein